MRTVFFGFYFGDFFSRVFGRFNLRLDEVRRWSQLFQLQFLTLKHVLISYFSAFVTVDYNKSKTRFVFHPGVSTSQGSNLSEFFFCFFFLLHRFIFYSKVETYLTGELGDRPVERLFNELRIPTSLLLTLCLLRHNVTMAC